GCSLVQLKRHGSLTQHRLRLGQELARELGAMGWSGTAHGWHPVALTIWVSIRQSPVYQTRQGNLIVICETDHLGACLSTGAQQPPNKESSKSVQKEQARDLLKSIETGDQKPAG